MRFYSLVIIVAFASMALFPATSTCQSYPYASGNSFWKLYNTTYQLGFHAIDDDDSPYSELLNSTGWSYLKFPTKISVLKPHAYNIKSEVAFAYTKLNKNLPAQKYVAPYDYFSLDYNARFHFDFFDESYDRSSLGGGKRFNKGSLADIQKNMSITIYPLIGASIHYRSQENYRWNLSPNLGFGVQWWLVENLVALNAQSMAQFGMVFWDKGAFVRTAGFREASNLLHHSFGICYHYSEQAYERHIMRKNQRKRK